MYDGYKVKPLLIVLTKTSAYVKSYDGQTNWMYFLIEDDDLFEKYNTIWDEVSADMKKKFDSELVYDKKFLKTKIKFHCDKVADFYDKESPKADSNHTCLSVISPEYALRKVEIYYLQSIFKIV